MRSGKMNRCSNRFQSLKLPEKSSELKRGPNEEYEVVCFTRDKDRDK